MRRYGMVVGLVGSWGTTCTDVSIVETPGAATVRIETPQDGAVFEPGEPVRFVGSVVWDTAGEGVVDGRWLLDGQQLCSFGDFAVREPVEVACEIAVPTSPGDARITLTLDGDLGDSATDEIVVVVSDNERPTIDVEAPIATVRLYEGRLVELRARVADAEDDTESLSVAWTSSSGGALGQATAPDSGGIASTFVVLPAGEHALTATVTDSAGSTARDSVIVTVGPPNTAPSCGIDAPVDNERVRSDAVVTLRATVSDVDQPADELEVAWSSDVEGALGAGTTTSGGANTHLGRDLDSGLHLLTLRVEDEADGACTDLRTLRVNRVPTVTSAVLLPATPGPTTPLTCSAGALADADGDVVSATIAWTVNGAGAGAGATLTPQASASVVACVVTPHDGLEAGASASASVTIGVDPPSIASVEVTPNHPTAMSTLTCGYSGFVDPSGGTDHSTRQWTVGSSVVGSGPTLAGAFAVGDTATCIVTPSNGTRTGAPASDSVVVGNTAPTATASIDPALPEAGDGLRCVVAASDVDEQDLAAQVTWTVDGASFPRHAGEASLVTTSDHPGDTVAAGVIEGGERWACRAIVTDGVATIERTASVTVAFDAPQIASVSITPTGPRVSDTLTCSWSGFADPSGGPDQSTVVWTVGGQTVGTARSLSAGISKGDAVTCTVTPSNGTRTGMPKFAVAIIENSPPQFDVDLTPDPFVAGSAVICRVVDEHDADADDVDYTFSWRLDGRAFPVGTESQHLRTTSHPGDTIAAGFVQALQSWTCTVEGSDGEDEVLMSATQAVPGNPPTIQITGPSSNASHVTNTAQVAVSGLYTNAIGIATDTHEGSTLCTRSGTTASGTFTCPTLTVPEYDVTVTVRAGDGTREVPDSITLRYQPSTPPPTLQITGPTTSTSWTGTSSTLTVFGTQSGATSVRYNIDGGASTDCARTTSTFTCSNVPLTTSYRRITVTATNSGGSATDALDARYQLPCTDNDDDGYGVGSGCIASDCNDDDDEIYQGAFETCDGKDNDCNGSFDDGDCWRAIYRYQKASNGRRCWGTTNTGPPSTCTGYGYEIEAFVVMTQPVLGAVQMRQCSSQDDHILVRTNDPDYTTLVNDGYNCSVSIGYVWPVGAAPTSGLPFGRVCRLWRYAHPTVGGTGHFFTRGADDVSAMTCEPPARAEVVTTHPCFTGTAPGCN